MPRTRSREQLQAKRGAAARSAQRLFPEQAVQDLSASSVSSSSLCQRGGQVAMRLKASLRPMSSSLLAPEVALALDRQALDQQARGHLVVGRQHEPRVELFGLQHVVLQHLGHLLQRLARSPCSGTTPW
jgi:hypothetical protein